MKRNKRKHPLKARAAGLAAALALFVLAAPAADAAAEYYPKCAAWYASFADALASVGGDASFSARKTVAALNGVSGYTGAAAQNILLLNKLKSGALLRSSGASAPLSANLAGVRYIAQDAKTCKATAVAMAVNLLRGSNVCTTAGMGGANCASIEGLNYRGSDGILYTGTYKTDSYVGRAAELTAAVTAALAAGVPIVAAVHSTLSGGTKHHWVVVVGRSGNDYLIVDPAAGTSGSMAANVTTLSARHYAFGLTDYSTPHYGYVAFIKK